MNENELNEIIEKVESNPVLSRPHEWDRWEQEEYDSLVARGRTLYDNLRTQEDFSHGDAYGAAANRYGLKQTRI